MLDDIEFTFNNNIILTNIYNKDTEYECIYFL